MTTYYFGVVPGEYVDDHDANIPEGWEPGWYFRIRVEYGDEEIKVEDSCGRMVPFQFKDIKALRRTLKLIKKEICYE